MANEIKLTFAGDSTSLDRSFKSVGDSAEKMSDELEEAGKSTGRFSAGVSNMNERIDSAESKFMGTADLVDGLSSALGISLGPTVEYARAFGDIAGGFTATLGPALEQMTGKFGKLSIVTKAQTLAQTALNTVMSLNPIFLVVAAIVALTAAFVIAYKQSETFRNIVNGAFGAVKNVVMGVVSWIRTNWPLLLAVLTGPFGLAVLAITKNKDKIVGILTSLKDTATSLFRGLGDVLTAPFTWAIDAVRSLWNNTLGGKGWDKVSIPFAPDLPGFRIPMLAGGGIAHAKRPHIVGEKGPELFVPNSTGTVIPNSALGGGQLTIRFAPSGDPILEAIRYVIRTEFAGSAQAALGTG